ncbi:MAG: TonB-dependent receptor [bacterium]|nr:TonB-dependent receptor [bacterium]
MKRNLKLVLCAGVLASLCMTTQANAFEEITLDNSSAISSATNQEIAYNVPNIDVRSDVDAQSQMDFVSEDPSLRLSQALAPQIALGEDTEGSVSEEAGYQPTFIDRITKQEYRPGPVRMFNDEGWKFDRGPIKRIKMGFFYFGTDTISWPYNDSVSSKWKDGCAELSAQVYFREKGDSKTYLRLNYNFLRNLDNHPSGFMERWSELGLVHEFNKHNAIHVGQTYRLPITLEGYKNTSALDMPTRTQIGRTYGNTRSFGVRYIGNYKYADFDLGVYNSTRYWRKFNGNGGDFSGIVRFYPFANLDKDKWGKITIGSTLNAGRNDNQYVVSSVFLGYDYKRFHNLFEYAHANGYNNDTTCSSAVSEGFYDTMMFDITKKLQLVGRFDYLNANVEKRTGNISREYSVGLNYRINKNLRLLGSYMFRQITDGTYSHAVALQAQVKL